MRLVYLFRAASKRAWKLEEAAEVSRTADIGLRETLDDVSGRGKTRARRDTWVLSVGPEHFLCLPMALIPVAHVVYNCETQQFLFSEFPV